jgi:xanthosine phosphorylase
MAVPVRTVRALGAELVLLTNAAGSLRAEVGPGRLMALTDHINMTGRNPLVGAEFVGMGKAYDPELLERLRTAATRAAVDLSEGVYLAVPGPSFETAAEIRAFRTLGADAVGMSTVLETIAARQCGLRVAAVSAITNLAEGMSAEVLSHEGTLHAAGQAAGDLARLLRHFVEDLA